jgi:hypothetical protein
VPVDGSDEEEGGRPRQGVGLRVTTSLQGLEPAALAPAVGMAVTPLMTSASRMPLQTNGTLSSTPGCNRSFNSLVGRLPPRVAARSMA